ncbi:protein DA1-related 1-like isoform X2 [Camellia sinensis]|uniref:protein DA1-related 1-like isoform X2 n=1 Tax=Camellia sinensis TaxID=4442 RepID=UPI001036BF9F|nr:protein DA1-related 1-like isoform X2 [Camellia sinensis]
MGWLNKIFKGSSHKVSEGQYDSDGRFGEDTIGNGPSSSGDAWSEIEDMDLAIVLSLSEEDKRKSVVDNESQLKEDEQLAKAIQESLNVESSPRHVNGNIYQPIPFPYSTGFRTCAGCNTEIGHGRFLNCMGAVWHPECFRCHACHQPICDYEFSMSGNYPYHKSCYKENYHPKCDVCKHFIPTNAAGLIEYRAHPFWVQKYCPVHENDGTPRCCSCERMEGHHHMPETRGLCLSEEQTVSTILRRPRIGAGNRIMNMITEPYKLTRRCEVTAILILYGLPRLLTGSILAHEMMHAWLRLQGYRTLPQDVEEGICQVLAHMWLESQIMSISGNNIASTSSSTSVSRSSKQGTRSPFERKLGEFFKHQIESDTSPVYGNGFRAGNQAVLKYGLRMTLDHIRLTGSFPY